MAEEEYVYFKKNVNFNIAVKFHMRDNEGLVLNNANPYINIAKNKLREFQQANKYFFEKGMLKQVDEPVFDFVTDNAITDEEAATIVKNLFVLKKKIPQITSETALLKLYEQATKQKRPQSIISLIEDRIDIVNPTLLQGGVFGPDTEKVEE